MGYNADEETDAVYENVPLYKKILCGNNPLGDWHYRFWKDLDCTCCAFYRGIIIGMIYMGIFSMMVSLFT